MRILFAINKIYLFKYRSFTPYILFIRCTWMLVSIHAPAAGIKILVSSDR